MLVNFRSLWFNFRFLESIEYKEQTGSDQNPSDFVSSDKLYSEYRWAARVGSRKSGFRKIVLPMLLLLYPRFQTTLVCNIIQTIALIDFISFIVKCLIGPVG